VESEREVGGKLWPEVSIFSRIQNFDDWEGERKEF
jgi:hypothetical protein